MKLYTTEEVENQASGRLAAGENKCWRGQEVLRWSWCFSRSWEREAGEGKEEVSPRGDKNHSPADKKASHEDKSPCSFLEKVLSPFCRK